ncbi:DUF5753 domain-containing protein [Amycolatopsis sp. NPDC005232]|uniref:DUF5753 domain-containing protein n=1 Tax=Amycolatopsis sp. NPDC005232 TaxID=3157027 RepID=UPI0033A025E9
MRRVEPHPFMSAAGNSDAVVEAGVTFQMRRQKTLFSSKTEFHAIIGELALRYPECDDDEVMIEQLRFLLEVSRRKQITLQVVPLAARYSPLRDGAFVLIRGIDPGSDVVYLEHYATSSTLTADQYIRGYQSAAEQLRRQAMSPEESVSLIADLIEEMEGGDDQ